MRPAGLKLDTRHLRVLVCVDASFPTLLKQQLIEFGSTHFEGMIGTIAKCLGEVEGLVFVPGIGYGEVGSQLGDANAPNLFENAQPLEDRQIHRQKGFADMKSGMLIPLE
jgi:hypothetical protein